MHSRLKRLQRREVPGQVRYLTCSCAGRLPLLTNDAIKEAPVEHLTLTKARLEFKLIAWVIMPEHFHLLLLPLFPGATVTRILAALKRPFAARVLARWRDLHAPILPRLVDSCGAPRFWLPGGGHDRNIYTGRELWQKLRYIHRNPVKRGLVAHPAEYLARNTPARQSITHTRSIDSCRRTSASATRARDRPSHDHVKWLDIRMRPRARPTTAEMTEARSRTACRRR